MEMVRNTAQETVRKEIIWWRVALVVGIVIATVIAGALVLLRRGPTQEGQGQEAHFSFSTDFDYDFWTKYKRVRVIVEDESETTTVATETFSTDEIWGSWQPGQFLWRDISLDPGNYTVVFEHENSAVPDLKIAATFKGRESYELIVDTGEQSFHVRGSDLNYDPNYTPPPSFSTGINACAVECAPRLVIRLYLESRNSGWHGVLEAEETLR